MSEPFVINVADAPARRFAGSGTFVTFEDQSDRFPDYPVSAKAAERGASVSEPTDDARTAYAGWTSEFESTKLPWPPG
jgi:hypothetical protein